MNGSVFVYLVLTEEDAAWVWAKSGLRCTLLPKVYATLGNGVRVWDWTFSLAIDR